MVRRVQTPIRVGATVRVPWGFDRDVEGTVVEVWGDPPTQVRVRLHMEDDDEAGPVVLLLPPTAVTAA